MKPEGCICVFAKPPIPGQVKTRLVAAVGEEGAAALAAAFLEDTLAAVRSLGWAHPVIASTGPWVPPGEAAEVWLQGEGDLGERVERILRQGLERFRFAIALGADSPGLPVRELQRAREALHRADAVIGPCHDGGFYLLGLRRCPAGLLAGLPWSQAGTFEAVVARLKDAQMAVQVLEPWFDVDRPEDLSELQERVSAGQIAAPRTRRVLERLARTGEPGTAAAVSVVIPALNERESLPAILEALRGRPWVCEVIVVDGGSTDGTREWLERQPGIGVVDAPRGRGSQMNAGARVAKGDVLLFLHADCVPPDDAGERIIEALRDGKGAGGCFLLDFGARGKASLRLMAAGINARTRLFRTATGDQAIFARRAVFEAIGGYRDWPLFEDVDLVRRLKATGGFRVVPAAVTASPRRYLRHGVFRTMLLFYVLRAAFWAGVSPHRLDRCLKRGVAADAHGGPDESMAHTR